MTQHVQQFDGEWKTIEATIELFKNGVFHVKHKLIPGSKGMYRVVEIDDEKNVRPLKGQIKFV